MAAKKNAKPTAKRTGKSGRASKSARAPSSKLVWQKVFIKAGAAMMVNPPKGYTKWLAGSGAIPLDVDMVELQRGEDCAVENAWLFAESVDDVEQHMPTIARHAGAATNVIVSYRKGGRELHRDTLWAAMAPFGFEGVSLVAVDDVWSAMRFKRG